MQKGRKILIAQLGQGKYQMTNYAQVENGAKNGSYKNPLYTAGYSFEAVYHQLCSDVEKCTQGTEKDIILLAGTESSFWGSLCVYFFMKKEIEDSGSIAVTQENLEKLREYLCDDVIKPEDISIVCGAGKEGYSIKRMQEEQVRQKVAVFLDTYAGLENARFKIVILQHGLDDEQIQKNFTVLQKAIEDVLTEDILSEKTNADLVHLCFDITMGFRSLPMYIYTFANYLTRVRPEKFRLHVYYGMADARQKKQLDGEIINWTPLVNLRKIDELMQWINVVNEFRSYGSVRGLTKLLDAHEDWNVVIDESNGKSLKDVFTFFDYATNANNLNVLESTIATISNLEQFLTDDLNLPEEAVILLRDIAKDFKNRFGQKQSSYYYGNLTIQLAKWYYEQGRIGNGAIALQEGVITYIMERYPNLLGAASFKKKDLFDYYNRQPAKKVVESMKKSGVRAASAFCYVRDNIRNVSSHILMKEIEKQDMQEQKTEFSWLLNYMLEELHEEVVHEDGTENMSDSLKNFLCDKDNLPYKKTEIDVFLEEQSMKRCDFDGYMEYIAKRLLGEKCLQNNEQAKEKVFENTSWGKILAEAFENYIKAELEAAKNNIDFECKSSCKLLQSLIVEKNRQDRINSQNESAEAMECKKIPECVIRSVKPQNNRKKSQALKLVNYYKLNIKLFGKIIGSYEQKRI